MTNPTQASDTLKDIRSMMERSSRFISLSGLSGIAAGICGLIGGYLAYIKLDNGNIETITNPSETSIQLLQIGLVTLAAALISAFLFTYLRSKKTGVAVWGAVAKRVMVSITVPMLVGGLVIIRLLQLELFELIAPACLLFYGLGLLNVSKYTYPEVKYLSYAMLILGIVNLWKPEFGLYLWIIGFGILHIIYGIIMWSRYEREVK